MDGNMNMLDYMVALNNIESWLEGKPAGSKIEGSKINGTFNGQNRGNAMRSLIAAACLMVMVLPSVACAQQGSNGVTVLGYHIGEPVRVDQPMEWHQAQDYIPQELWQSPDTPLSPEQIFERVRAVQMEKIAQFEAILDKLTEESMAQNPDQEPDYARLVIAEWALADDPTLNPGDFGADIVTPEVQKLAQDHDFYGLARTVMGLSILIDNIPVGDSPAVAPGGAPQP